MIFSDAHFHFCEWKRMSGAAFAESALAQGLYCACALSSEEFLACEGLKARFSASASGCVVVSFGAHPQLPAVLAREGKSPAEIRGELARLLEAISSLAMDSRVDAVGEAGFDFYTDEFAAWEKAQNELFDAQIEIAQRASLPLVIHARKGQDKVFARTRELKRLSAAIFHGYSGSGGEAISLLRRGVNAYFSFGKVLLRGSIKAAETLKAIPRERILTETDAPFMTLKGETFSSPRDIERVAGRAAEILSIPIEELAGLACRNFRAAFALKGS